MKTKQALLIPFFVLLIASTRAQLTYDNLEVQYDSAIVFKNLKIIPVREKGAGISGRMEIMSLSEAIRSNWVVLSERGTASTENVHWLRINNNSDRPIFVGSGQIILGGRQDRMVTKDTVLVPNGRDQYIPVMCVEEDRWSNKEKKFVYFNYANPSLRKTLDVGKNQVLIWREVARQLESNKILSQSLAYSGTRLDKKILPAMDEYMTYFKTKFHQTDSTIAGIVCVTGNKIIGADIFDEVHLFYAELDALLEGYVEEAVVAGAPVTIKDQTIKKYMDKILTDEKQQEEFLRLKGKIFKFQGRVIHITAFGE